MYYVRKTFEISAAHKLNLDYESKCSNLHGHNWRITVFCASDRLDQNGMVIDFSKISAIVSKLDHNNLNTVLSQPTAENIAHWIAQNVPKCYKVEVQESSGNIAVYEDYAFEAFEGIKG